jgi:hypothetical protein
MTPHFVPRYADLSRGCRSLRSVRLHTLYRVALDVVTLLVVAFFVWSFLTVVLGLA